MKKTKSIILLACAAASVLSSCARISPAGESGLMDLTIGASCIAEENEPTRSTYIYNVGFTWTPDDEMSIFDGTDNRRFITFANASSAVFHGQVSEDWTTLVGVYPYNESNTCEDGLVSVEIPSTQAANLGGYSDGSNPSVGVTSSAESLQMKSVGAYMRFVFESTEDVRAIFIVANNEENLSGTFKVDPATAVVSSVTAGKSFVTIYDGAGAITPGRYYAVVNPVTLSKGLSVFFKLSDGTIKRKTGVSSATLKTRRVLDLGTINVDALAEETDEADLFEDQTVTLDFSSNSVFTESIGTSKQYGTKTYETTAEGLEVTFRVTYVDAETGTPTTRGQGWLRVSAGYLNFCPNNRYGASGSEALDCITMPVIEGKRLSKAVWTVRDAASFRMLIVDSQGEMVAEDTDESLWNSSGNWLANTSPVFILSPSLPGTAYSFAARKSNAFHYCKKLVLTYESLILSGQIAPPPSPEFSDVGFAGITEDNPSNFIW